MLLTPQEFTHFSLSLPLCLLGERQDLLGLGSVALATTLRMKMHVEEAPGEFQIVAGGEGLSFGAKARELAERWRELLGHRAVVDRDELDGLTLTIDPGPLGQWLPAEAVLRSPLFAVGAFCSVRAFRGAGEQISAEDLARVASGLLSELEHARATDWLRFYPLALLCIEGGARFVEPGAGTINLQQLIPQDSLLLAVQPGAGPLPAEAAMEKRASEALRRSGVSAAELVASNEKDLGRFFELASDRLDERDTAVLYALLRARQLVLELVEQLDKPLFDHDLLAEMCDEESALIEDCLGFPAADYEPVRQRAIEAGALGAKCVWGPASRPCVLIIAPGRRDSVREVLAEGFADALLLPAEVDSDGLRPE